MKSLYKRILEVANESSTNHYYKSLLASIAIDVKELQEIIAVYVDPTGLDNRTQEICRECSDVLNEKDQ